MSGGGAAEKDLDVCLDRQLRTCDYDSLRGCVQETCGAGAWGMALKARQAARKVEDGYKSGFKVEENIV